MEYDTNSGFNARALNPSLPTQDGKDSNPYADFSTDKILRALGVAGYKPTGSTSMFLPGLYGKLSTELERRGVDTSQIPEYTSVSDVLANIGPISKITGRNRSNVRERLKELESTGLLEEERQRRNAAIDIAKNALDSFLEDKSYDDLLARIRALPQTLSDEDISFLRRTAVEQARSQETHRLRRVISSIGLRGFGSSSGAIAALAERAASEADKQIGDAFNSIYMEKLRTRRQDELSSLGMEESLLSAKRTAGLQFQQNYQATLAGLPLPDVTAPMDYFSQFLESLRAREMSEDIARANNRAALLSSGIGAVGAVGAAIVTGGAAAPLVLTAADTVAQNANK